MFKGKKFVEVVVFRNGSYLCEDDFSLLPLKNRIGKMKILHNTYYSFGSEDELHEYIINRIENEFRGKIR